jgi:multimeric flavodoxin WrbA
VKLQAVFLSCTLRHSPEVSNAEALASKVVQWLDRMDVASEMIKVVDYKVPTGVSSDEGEGDEWPRMLERITPADILVVATPIWFGHRSSVAQLVIERLDGTYDERNEVGQYPLYNKVGGVVVTGNEDGAHSAAESTLFNLSHLGCTIPPNSDTYWGGRRGTGPVSCGRGWREPSLHAGNHSLEGAQPRAPRAHAEAEPDPPEGNTFEEETEHAPHIG